MTAGYVPGRWVYRPRHERPLGVALLAAIIGFIGFLFLIVGILAALASFATGFHYAGMDFGFGRISGSLLVVGLIILIFGIIIMALALGLWHLERWALVLSLLVFGILFVLDILNLDIYALFWGLIVVYLILVREHFD